MAIGQLVSNVLIPSTLFAHLKSHKSGPGCILSGFDFPIGVSYSYAHKTGITDFLSILPLLGHNELDKFYLPALDPSEIGPYHPFYPARPGSSRRSHLENGLIIPFNRSIDYA
jgi:hypothetical protein